MTSPVLGLQEPLRPLPETPRLSAGARSVCDGVTVGEWSMTRAAWTDRHLHLETNTVLEGELHVTCDGHEVVARVGDTVMVPAGAIARYAAPVHARMLFVYGPGPAGSFDEAYEEL